MCCIPVQPRPIRRNNRAATDEHPAMITPDAVRAIQSLWPGTQAGGAPATKLGLARLRASQINGHSVCAGTGAEKGQAGR
jgi:alkylhydroperoxidase family enzyme